MLVLARNSSHYNEGARQNSSRCKEKTPKPAQVWDLDSEVDDAEFALRNLDKLMKDEVYKLTTETLKSQRELVKMQKVAMV